MIEEWEEVRKMAETTITLLKYKKIANCKVLS